MLKCFFCLPESAIGPDRFFSTTVKTRQNLNSGKGEVHNSDNLTALIKQYLLGYLAANEQNRTDILEARKKWKCVRF